MITMLLTELNNLANIRWIIILIGFLLTLFIVVNPNGNYVMKYLHLKIWKLSNLKDLYDYTIITDIYTNSVMFDDGFVHSCSFLHRNKFERRLSPQIFCTIWGQLSSRPDTDWRAITNQKALSTSFVYVEVSKLCRFNHYYSTIFVFY